MIKKIRKLLPFTYEKIIKNHVDKSAVTILDLGCGDGALLKFINNENKFEVTGVDAFSPFLKKAKSTGAYKTLLKMDVRDINFPPKSYDVVITSQVLEYLSKKEGIEFIKKCEKIAKKQVIVAAYIGNCYHTDAQGNPYQTSNSEWYPQDLKKLKYKIYGQGFRKIYTEEGYKPKKISILDIVPIAIAYLMSPIVYANPQYASHMICVKKIKKA